MPSIIDPNTTYVDDLPGIWAPVQWETTPEEAEQELMEQARASLLWVIDAPEAALRLFLDETDIERAYEPPPGYDPEQQGEWDYDLLTFQFKRRISLRHMERQTDYLLVLYDVEGLGTWSVEITPTSVVIEKI
ncbi:MAG: hypothetical protein D6755_12875 [Anaerolineae bacterium]|nr:MAG: hypothetical protein D6755_12875 [Anaerolineae bacterium]